jgi:iron-only hydrogenase group A
MIFNIEVNNKIIKARKGDTILNTLRRNGISVPTLCNMENFSPTGACRICVVEVEGHDDLVPSCSYPVKEWMKIHTNSPRVIRARRTIVELLLSSHPDDCLYCIRNRNCELQNLADEMGIRERRLPIVKKHRKRDNSSISILRDPEKCILCGRCVRVCKEVIGVSTYDFIGKGMKTKIGPTFDNPMNVSNCITCGQCIMVCPTGALHENDNINLIQQALQDKNKYPVVQISPTISVSLAEEFGLKSGKDIDNLMVAALRKLGFKKVFKTAFAVDILVIQLASEIISRIENNLPLPVLSSDCPAFVKFMEEYHPDMLHYLSIYKSPQQMMGSLIKHHFARKQKVKSENIFTVSLMPCTAKKFEASREEHSHNSIQDVDAVITTRELARLIRLYGVDILQANPEMPDTPFALRSSAGKIAGTSGGIAEAVYRTVYYQITGKNLVNYKITQLRSSKTYKQVHATMGKTKIGIGAVSGIQNAKDILEQIRAGRSDLHFIEIMACPGSCIAGGGQPITRNKDAVKARMKALYDIDDKESIKVPYRNPGVNELFEKYTGKENESFNQNFTTSFRKRDVLL